MWLLERLKALQRQHALQMTDGNVKLPCMRISPLQWVSLSHQPGSFPALSFSLQDGEKRYGEKMDQKGSWVKIKVILYPAQIHSFTPDFCTHFLPSTTSGPWVCCGDGWNQLCPAWDSPSSLKRLSKWWNYPLQLTYVLRRSSSLLLFSAANQTSEPLGRLL